MEEFEAIFTDINLDGIRNKLKTLGARKIFEKTYRRLNFEYPDWRLDKDHSWIRLRDEGDKITLAFKKRLGPGEGDNGNDLGMREIEFEVSDYNKTRDFFLAIGLVHKLEVENRRERWLFKDIQFDIDTYPLIPTYLEIESSSWAKVKEGSELLDLDYNQKRICSATQIAKDYGIITQDYSIFTFDRQIKHQTRI
ncbi:MAG TPA: CYTH domain-containing protein [Patescibacteria group bacterium]|nr:CYTH domain-containing protein [Patescibacteria group bacterium]